MFSYGSHPRGKPEAFFIEINRKYIHFTLYGLQGSTRIIVYSAIWIASLVLAFYALSLVRDPVDLISPLA